MKTFVLTLLVFLFALPSNACDMCGCYMGITPYDNQSSFGLYHRYRSFNGYGNVNQKAQFFPKTPLSQNNSNSPSLYPTQKHGDNHSSPSYSENDYELYSMIELRGKFFIHERIELNGILPFAMNKVRINDTVTNLNSLGDINLYGGYHLIRPDVNKNVQQRLILGTGIKLATGHYYIKNKIGNRVNLLNQPGSGSNDIMIYTSYVIGIKKWGLSTNFSYKINGENYYKERIGNSITNFTNVFYKLKKGDFIFIPSAQSYFESSSGLFIDGIYQSSTSVKQLMLGPGLDIYYKNWGLNTNFQFTLFEDYHDGNLRSGCKLLIGLTYNFNQLKYLFSKSK